MQKNVLTENILEKNLQYIAKYNPELAKKIVELTELEGNFEIKNSKSGDAVLYRDNIATDDIVDPAWKAVEESKKLKFKIKRSITVLIGLGLGYMLRELSSRYQGNIIVYEPDINLLRITLEIVDFSDLLQKDNIKIVSSYSELETIYSKVFFIHYKLNMICSKYYLMNHAPESGQIKEKIENLHSIYQSNYRSLFNKNSGWTHMVFKNIPEIIKNQDLDVLKDKFQGKTAVIISAGPSLDKNIQDLKPYRDKVAVFCVGTALKTAVKHGVIPDFAVAVENFKSTFLNLNVPEISDINLVLSTRAYPEAYKLEAKRIYNYHGQNAPASKWAGQILEKSFDLYNEAGTVSLTAFYSARMMGFDKFIFIGQDLAYTDNRCYSKDTAFGNFTLDGSNTVNANNIEHAAKSLSVVEEEIKSHAGFLGRELLYVKGCMENKVITTPSLLLFIKYFEDMAEKFGPEVKLVNATEGGAYLQGLEHISLNEALKKYTDEDFSPEQTLKTLNMTHKQLVKRKQIFLEKLREIIRNYHKSKEIISDLFENEIMQRFDLQEEIDVFTDHFKKYDINGLVFKHMGKEKQITPEEREIFETYAGNAKRRNNKIRKEIDHVFRNNFESFSQNLRLVKEKYLEAEKILSKNAYLYNFLFHHFLITRFLIKDFDGTEGCLQCMSNCLNLFIARLYFTSIDPVKEMVNKLEM